MLRMLAPSSGSFGDIYSFVQSSSSSSHNRAAFSEEELEFLEHGRKSSDSIHTAKGGKRSSSQLTMGFEVEDSCFLDEAQSLKRHQDEEDEDAISRGVESVNLLVACAEAIAARSTSLVHRFLNRLGEIANPRGDIAIERVAAYFTEALACRAAADRPDVYTPLPLDLGPSDGYGEGDASAIHVLNYVTPIVKFGHFTANEAILRGTDGYDRIHVVDLDVGTGLQWPPLLQAMATRESGRPSLVRVTGVGSSRDGVEETGERLEELARSLGLGFEFHAIAAERLDDVRLWMLHIKEGEAVAVNCVSQLHKSLGDTARMKAALELIRATKPKVVAMVEQESNHNSSDFLDRFPMALKYYAAVFDAIESSGLPSTSRARMSVERCIFAREIRNIVACDGDDFVERHERFGRWSEMMKAAGFRGKDLGPRSLVQARLLLAMFACKDYRLVEVSDGIGNASGISLTWLDQPLLTASAWELRSNL